MRGLFLLPLLALPTNAAASTYFGATVSLQEALTGDPDLVDVSSLSIVSYDSQSRQFQTASGSRLIDLNGDNLPDRLMSLTYTGNAAIQNTGNLVKLNNGCGWVSEAEFYEDGYCSDEHGLGVPIDDVGYSHSMDVSHQLWPFLNGSTIDLVSYDNINNTGSRRFFTSSIMELTDVNGDGFPDLVMNLAYTGDGRAQGNGDIVKLNNGCRWVTEADFAQDGICMQARRTLKESTPSATPNAKSCGPNPDQLSVGEISDWLLSIDVPAKHVEVARQMSVDAGAMLLLEKDDFSEIGVTSKVLQAKIVGNWKIFRESYLLCSLWQQAE